MIWIVPAVALAMTSMYMLSLKPERQGKKDFKPFEDVMIAHRGFYDNDSDAPENSLLAFKKAVQKGFGVELDVQITKDGELVVFHDETLRRMCGANVKVTDLTFDELEKYTLMDSKERIPKFSDVFDIVKNKVPMLVEIKAHGPYIKTAEKLMTYLDPYDGPYMVQSFHPKLVRWFRKNRPKVPRGQLSMVYAKKSTKAPLVARFFSTNLMTNFYAKPDFISYNFAQADQFSYKLMRKLYKVENAGWTIRSKSDLEKAKKVFRIFIFDGFDPTESDPDE